MGGEGPSLEEQRSSRSARRSLVWAGGVGIVAFLVLITLGGAVAGRAVRQFMGVTDDALVWAWIAGAVGGLALTWLAVRLALAAADQVRLAGRRNGVLGVTGLYLALLTAVLASSLVTQAIADGTLVGALGVSGAMTGGQAVLGVTALVLAVAAVVVLRRWWTELPDAE